MGTLKKTLRLRKEVSFSHHQLAKICSVTVKKHYFHTRNKDVFVINDFLWFC